MATLRQLAQADADRPKEIVYLNQPGNAVPPCRVLAKLIDMTDDETARGNRVLTLVFELLTKHAGSRIQRGYFETNEKALAFIRNDAQAFQWDETLMEDPDLDIEDLALDDVWAQREAFLNQEVYIQLLYESEKFTNPDTGDEGWRDKGHPDHNGGKDDRQNKVHKVFHKSEYYKKHAEPAA